MAFMRMERFAPCIRFFSVGMGVGCRLAFGAWIILLEFAEAGQADTGSRSKVSYSQYYYYGEQRTTAA